MAAAAPKPSLKVDKVKIDTLTQHPQNPRRGDVGVIADSLAAHGQYQPLIVQKSTGYVLAGNHRLQAAQELGWDTIEVIYLDVDDEKAKRILLVDNKSSDTAGYDDDALTALLQDLPNLDATGWTPTELEDMLDTLSLPAPLKLRTHESEGERLAGVSLEWGFVAWKSTRIQITAAEVEALDAKFKAYTKENKAEAGFGWALAGDDEAAAAETIAQAVAEDAGVDGE